MGWPQQPPTERVSDISKKNALQLDWQYVGYDISCQF